MVHDGREAAIERMLSEHGGSLLRLTYRVDASTQVHDITVPLSGKRPKESLIYIDVGDGYPGIRLAFKYRWKEKKVILPADEAEEAEWIAKGEPAPLG